MCHRVQCRKCAKPTWTGCGLHIEQALSGVPVDQRCRCDEDAPAVSTTPPPPLSLPATPPRPKSFIDRLFGR